MTGTGWKNTYFGAYMQYESPPSHFVLFLLKYYPLVLNHLKCVQQDCKL